MPRWPQNVSAQYPSIGDLLLHNRVGHTCSALRDSPFGTGVVLRLHCAEESDNLAARSKSLLREVLIREAQCAKAGTSLGCLRHFVRYVLTEPS